MQLLNQFENTGPPPADKERIKSLPTISITEEHVGMCNTVLSYWCPNDSTLMLDSFMSVL